MGIDKSKKSDLLLLLAAAIWGFAFVAQKIGMDYVGPFTYNGVRFALGALVLIPFIAFKKNPENIPHPDEKKYLFKGGSIAGVLLFAGVSSQQLGLIYTTAGNAGFITGLYVVFVPIAGLFLGHKTNWLIWTGVLLAGIGLYFLSVTADSQINKGDLLVLICAIVWTFHVLVIAKYSPLVDTLKLAFIQFVVCSLLCMSFAFIFDDVSIKGIIDAALPIAYGGFLSVGIAYTLQVFVQKNAHPTAAAIILSLESVFAAIGGWIFLSEPASLRGIFGAALMFAGMILAQINPRKKL